MKKLLAALSGKQRITMAIAALLVGAGIFGLTRWRRESDFKPLYTGLAPEDAGAVVQKLKEGGVEYRLSESGAEVLAPSGRVAELRLEMAAAGLPKSGRIGYELFDKTNFGATEFTEHINYGRALEGELERSMMSLAEVDRARVHVTFPKDSVFLDSKQPAKASVMLRLRPGARLSAQNVIAVTNVVASAVEGLAPEAVSVLDMRGNLLSRPRRSGSLDDGQPSEATIEFRQKIEGDLLAKINATLDPLLGAEKFRAGVSVECDFTSGEQSDETLDPTKSVMSSSQKTEENTTSNSSAGQPGTASNLPRPAPRPGGSGGGTSRRNENIVYQSSRTVRHVRLPQGTVKRMSLSVLVDQDARWEGTGVKMKRIITPPPPEKLKAIRELVAAVTGLTPERGDQIVVESLPFEATLTMEAPTSAPPAHAEPDPRIPKWLLPVWNGPRMPLIGAGAALVLLLLLGGLFMVLRKRKPAIVATAPLALPASAGLAGLNGAAGISSEDVEKQMAAKMAEQAALQQRSESEALQALMFGNVTTKKAEVLLKHLRDTVQKDSPATTKILRTWLNEREGKSRA
ncbi:MAG: flagellar M-ring protein FliF [Acidobacteriota bacterium]|nr:flagellar M-ring protein FliF [Acidobacteriota bacterium]